MFHFLLSFNLGFRLGYVIFSPLASRLPGLAWRSLLTPDFGDWNPLIGDYKNIKLIKMSSIISIILKGTEFKSVPGMV
jgi:hypothetical protein